MSSSSDREPPPSRSLHSKHICCEQISRVGALSNLRKFETIGKYSQFDKGQAAQLCIRVLSRYCPLLPTNLEVPGRLYTAYRAERQSVSEDNCCLKAIRLPIVMGW